MPVPYGFGVGDIIALGTLAWAVYKSCKEAPESFKNIHIEVLSLHAVTKEAEETIFKTPLAPERQARLAVVKDGCGAVLTDLELLVKKYESLGTKSKRTWDRMRWGNEDLNEIRARLNTNATLLAAFISTSQVSVEQKLDKFLQEFKQGKREDSVISVQTVDSLTKDERAVWRTIRKELEDIGISTTAWQNNHEFILNWFKRMIETGAFEEDAISSDGDNLDVVSPASVQPNLDAISPAFKQPNLDAMSQASEQSPGLSQPATETQAPSAEYHTPEEPEDSLNGEQLARFDRPLVVLEDTFYCYVAALRARSGRREVIGKPKSFSAYKTTCYDPHVLMLSRNMIGDPYSTKITDAISIEVLLTAFVRFVSSTWKYEKGPLIGQGALQTLQTTFGSHPNDFARTVTNFLKEITPQNRRCLVTTIELFRALRKDSINERSNLDFWFASLLTSPSEAHRYVRLYSPMLHRFLDDFDSLFPQKKIDSDASDGLISNLSVDDSNKKDDHGRQQPAKSSTRSPFLSNQNPASLDVESSMADHLRKGKATSLLFNLGSGAERDTTNSFSTTILPGTQKFFPLPKEKLLAAASDTGGAPSIAVLLAEHQFDQKVLGDALIKASDIGAVESMMLLVEKGADVNFVEETSKNTPLSTAVSTMKESAVVYLLAQGADVNYRNAFVKPALHIASKRKSFSLMKILVSAGAKLNVEGQSELSASDVFYEAVRFSFPEAVQILIHAGAQVNSSRSKGTPLIHALSCDREDVARLLLENGADVHQVSPTPLREGLHTPMKYAIFQNKPSQVQLLSDFNAITTLDEAMQLLEFSQYMKRNNAKFIPDDVEDSNNNHAIIGLIRDAIENLSNLGSHATLDEHSASMD